MTSVFSFGPIASGKLTVANQRRLLSGLPVFHNHLVVDTTLTLFEFGTSSFVKLRHEMWMAAFREAAAQGLSLVFTFTPVSYTHLRSIGGPDESEGPGGCIFA